MPLPTETIVSEQVATPEREARHELFYVGQWTLMVTYYGPSPKYADDGAHVDVAAWAWIDGAKCRMDFGLPLAAMQAVYEALGKVLPPTATGPQVDETYEAAVADLNPTFGGAA